MPANQTNCYPCLFYRDAKAAIAWLCEAFGFEVRIEVPGPEGTVAPRIWRVITGRSGLIGLLNCVWRERGRSGLALLDSTGTRGPGS